MFIRQATRDDATLLSQLNDHVQVHHAQAWPSLFRWPTDSKELLAYFEELITLPENKVFLVIDDQEACGYLYCELAHRAQTPFNPARAFLYIHHLVIKEPYRSQGYGQQLLQQAIDLASQEGIGQILLDVWTFNHQARLFFEHRGFRVFNERMYLAIE